MCSVYMNYLPTIGENCHIQGKNVGIPYMEHLGDDSESLPLDYYPDFEQEPVKV